MKNPPKFYWLHHFVALPLSLVAFLYTVRRYWSVAGDDSEISRLWFTAMLLALVLLITLVMLRQHYALGLQDRIIRLEMRQRYFELTGQRLPAQLSLKQLIALRLAGDGELPALIQVTLAEGLDPKAIQARIQDFQLDTLRV